MEVSKFPQTEKEDDRIVVQVAPDSQRQDFVPNPTDQKKPQKSRLVAFLDGTVIFSLMAIFFGLPIFFTGLSLQGLSFEKQLYFYAFLLVGLVAWITKGVAGGKLKIRKTPLDVPLAIFLVFYALATFFSVDKWHSFFGFFGDPSRGLLSVLAIATTYYLVFSNFSLRNFKLMAGSLVFSGALISLWATLALFVPQYVPSQVAKLLPVSLLGSVSGLVLFLGMMIPVSVSLAFAMGGKPGFVSKMLSILLSANILLNLVLLYALSSFVFWPGMLVGSGLFLVFTIAKIVRSKGASLALPVVVFVAVSLLAITGVQATGLLKTKLPFEVSPVQKLSWEISKGSLKNDFFLGSGPATYGHAFSLYKPESFNVDNKLFGLRLYEGGGIVHEAVSTIGGVGAILAVFLLLAYIGICFYLLSRDKEMNKAYSLGMFSSFVIFLFSLVATRVQGPMLLVGSLVAILSLAVMLKESDSEEEYIDLSLEASPKYALASSFLFVVAGVGVVFLFVLLGKIFVADVYAGKSSKLGEISEQGSVAGLKKAAEHNPREGRYFTRLGQEYMVLANAEMLKKEEEKDVNKIGAYLQESIANASKGATLMGGDVLAVQVLAQVFENGSFYIPQSLGKAEEWYRKALELEPNNPELHLKLGQILTAQSGQEKDENKKKEIVGKAKEKFADSVEKKKDFAAGYYNLGLADEALENLDASIENLSKAYVLERNNQVYAFSLGRVYQERGKKKMDADVDGFENDFAVAETLFSGILKENPNEINSRLSLAMLYADQSKKNEAVAEFEKVLSLLPEDDSENRERVRTMIEDVKAGRNGAQSENITIDAVQETENLTSETQTEAVSAEEQVQPSAPETGPSQPVDKDSFLGE